MKKLYQVEVTYSTYVLADDESEAEDIAVNEADDRPECIYAREVKSGHSVPHAWKGALVWGDDEERPIEKILAELK